MITFGLKSLFPLSHLLCLLSHLSPSFTAKPCARKNYSKIQVKSILLQELIEKKTSHEESAVSGVLMKRQNTSESVPTCKVAFTTVVGTQSISQ